MELMFAAVLALAQTPVHLPDSALSIGGIKIGDTEQHVRETLGKPLVDKDGVAEGYDGHLLRYDGLTVLTGLEDAPSIRYVYEFVSTSPNYCTAAGVCPGMKLARANAAYGKPIIANREDGSYYEYAVTDAACWFQLAVKHDVIQSIRVECQP